MAYIDADGSFVDNTMLLRDTEETKTSLKSNHLPSLEHMEFKLSKDDQKNEKIRINSNSLKKEFPQLLKYDTENNPVAIDKDQLLLLVLAKIKEHEKSIQELTVIIENQN